MALLYENVLVSQYENELVARWLLERVVCYSRLLLSIAVARICEDLSS